MSTLGLVVAVSAWLWVTPSHAQQTVLIDTSGSMAGFASHDSKITGFMQRVATNLHANGPATFQSFATVGDRPAITTLTENQAALIFSDAKNFRGNSPLTKTVAKTLQQKTTSLIVFTDGMEDEGRLADVAQMFADNANNHWAIGIASFMLPFDGNYYAEMKIPFAEFRPQIEKSLQESNKAFKIAPSACTASAVSTCYRYTGDRPLLALLFTKGESVEPLFTDLQEAAKESLMPPPEQVSLSPLRKYTPQFKAVFPVESQEWIRSGKPEPSAGSGQADSSKPKAAASSQFMLECLGSHQAPLVVSFSIAGVSTIGAAQTSEARPISVSIGQRPNWLHSITTEITPKKDGSSELKASITCLAPDLLSSMGKSSTVLPGELNLHFNLRNLPAGAGWWIDRSAPNSWQYPNRVYHLREVIEKVQSSLIDPEIPFEVTVKLKSRR